MSGVDDQSRLRQRPGFRELLEWIADSQEVVMAAIDDLRQSVADLQTSATAENAEVQQIASSLADAESQISQLQAAAASGAGVSEADLEALAQSITGVAQAAQAATSAASAGGGASAPAGGGAPAGAPAAPAGGGTGTDTGAGSAPAPAERSVYTFDGDPTTVDGTVWPSAPLLTSDTPPRQLYYYSGDTVPGQANGDGVGGVWHLYTGQTQPVPEPATTDTGAVATTGGAETAAEALPPDPGDQGGGSIES